jgi:uncharacterized membrane protein
MLITLDFLVIISFLFVCAGALCKKSGRKLMGLFFVVGAALFGVAFFVRLTFAEATPEYIQTDCKTACLNRHFPGKVSTEDSGAIKQFYWCCKGCDIAFYKAKGKVE